MYQDMKGIGRKGKEMERAYYIQGSDRRKQNIINGFKAIGVLQNGNRIKKVIILVKVFFDIYYQYNFNQMDKQSKQLFLSIGTMSILFSLVNPILYLLSPKLRQPPANLIFIICLIEISNCYHLLLYILNYNNDTYTFYKYLIYVFTFGYIDMSSQNIRKYYCIGDVFVYSFQLMLAIDFIIKMTIPFISLKIRTLVYLVFIVFANILDFINQSENAIIFCRDNYFTGNIFQYTIFQIEIYEVIQLNNIILKVLLFIYTTVASFIAYYNLHITKKQFPGIIYETKKQYMLNYLSCLLVFNIIWVVPLLASYLNKSAYEQIALAILLSQGIFLGLIRLNEKYFRFRLQMLFKQIICIISEKEKKLIDRIEKNEQENDDPTFVPLQELVNRYQIQILIKNIISAIKKSTLSYIEIQDDSIIRKCSEMRRINISVTKENVSGSLELQDKLLPKIEKKSELKIQLIEIAPQIFYEIRLRNGVSKNVISSSLDIECNENSIKSTSESVGKSGSFFFFSYDNKLVIKTLKKTEVKNLYDKMIVSYSNHLQKYPHTILSKIYGLYSVKIQGFNTIYIALMENTLQQMKNHFNPDRIYDLKGSLYSRITPNTSSVKKDLNFLYSKDIFIKMNQNTREKFFQQLEEDINLLSSCGFMDYSLLIAITDKPKKKRMNFIYPSSNQNWRFFESDKKYYSFAIIDYLQYYTLSKYLEFKFKSILRGTQIISCVEPQFYKTRFYAFCNQIIIIQNN